MLRTIAIALILVLSVGFSALFGISLGVITAVKQNTFTDYVFRGGAVFGQPARGHDRQVRHSVETGATVS